MISNVNILKLETRKEIYDYILKNPGLHLRELSRNIDISFGSLRHHLNYLEKQGLITTKVDHRYTRYYVTKSVGKSEKEILNLLRQETPSRIIILMLTPGPGEIFVDKKTQEKEMLKPSAHMKTYSKEELINLTRYWTGPYGKFFHLHKHPSTVNFHLKKLLDIGLVEKVKIGRKMKYKIKDENLIWSLFIKYKDTLSIKSIDLYLVWHNNAIVNIGDRVLNVLWDVFPHPYHP
jgi:DNA-binding transcriptional ArsR family regulator